MRTYTGGCHCGRVRFEVTTDIDRVVECNCSICSRKGYLHHFVDRARFRLIEGDGALSTYRFGTGVAQHLFCRQCGVASYYVPRSHPDGLSINVRCLDEVEVGAFQILRFDGRHWEESIGALKAGVP